MLDFTYYTPTKVFFGKDKHKEVGAIIKGYGYTNIMMQYGKESIKKSGLYDDVMKSLRDAASPSMKWAALNPIPRFLLCARRLKLPKKKRWK